MPRETFPAGVRTTIPIPLGLAGVLGTAGAVTVLLNHVIRYKGFLERASFIPEVAGAGAGATQAIRIRKGGATGTIVATVTITLANHVLGAAGVEGAVAAADTDVARFVDNDTLTITKDAGTVFTTAGGMLYLTFWQRPQAKQ